MFTTLISARELQQLISDSTPLRVFDCSFDLMKPDAGEAQFVEEHIPGSVHVHLDHHLSDKTGDDRWYDVHVPIADKLYDTHLATLRKEGLIDD